MSSTTSITTIRNGGNMSRYEMLEWMNGKVQGHITRIEDLCTGVAYCRMMGTIFPGSINMKLVKMMPRRKYEYKHNLRLLQEAFNRLELEQPVPIELIIQGRFKHNFEFIKFFKKFYDSQTNSSGERKVEDPESQGVLDEEEALPEDPEDIQDKQDIRAKWILKAQSPLGPEAEKLIDERDFAYHKLILIEREILKIDDDELGIRNHIFDVLEAPRSTELLAQKRLCRGCSFTAIGK